jgi:hypothetical protein
MCVGTSASLSAPRRLLTVTAWAISRSNRVLPCLHQNWSCVSCSRAFRGVKVVYHLVWLWTDWELYSQGSRNCVLGSRQMDSLEQSARAGRFGFEGAWAYAVADLGLQRQSPTSSCAAGREALLGPLSVGLAGPACFVDAGCSPWDGLGLPDCPRPLARLRPCGWASMCPILASKQTVSRGYRRPSKSHQRRGCWPLRPL